MVPQKHSHFLHSPLPPSLVSYRSAIRRALNCFKTRNNRCNGEIGETIVKVHFTPEIAFIAENKMSY